MAVKRKRWRQRISRFAAVAAVALCASTVLYRILPVPLTPLMVIRGLQGHGLEKDWEGLDAMGPLPAAVIGREDQRFCDHGGVDWVELEKVLRGQRSGGASTITMQTAKNVYLWPSLGGHPADYLRKLLEVPIAVGLETAWGKRRVLEVYMNVAEFGPGVYGAEAAARHHYDLRASELSDAQATALAALLPSPLTRSVRAQRPAEIAATRRAAADQLGCVSPTPGGN